MSALLLVVLLAAGARPAFSQTSPSYAWTNFVGQPKNSGTNDGTGSEARFDWPFGVAVDTNGNVFVADYHNMTIRTVTPAGMVTTLAGCAGALGSADGTGSEARFDFPSGVAVDGAGNIFVADSSTIRKVTPAGLVTTLAGSAGNPGSADGTGSAARFHGHLGVALDSGGNMFVADSGNDTIRKVTPDRVVTTLAGSAGNPGSTDGKGSAARFHCPSGVAVDSEGNLFVADTLNHTIRRVTPTGVVTTLAGSAGNAGRADGTGSAARFVWPIAAAVDSAGNVFVADYVTYSIRKVTPAGAVTTVGGGAGAGGKADGIGSSAGFNYPSGIAVDNAGNLYVADCRNNRICKGAPVRP